MNFTENVTLQLGKTYAINKKGSDTVVTLVDVAMRYWESLPFQNGKASRKMAGLASSLVHLPLTIVVLTWDMTVARL
jgi:hypothetical protein